MDFEYDFDKTMLSYVSEHKDTIDDFPLLATEAPFADGNLNIYLSCINDVISNDNNLPVFKANMQVNKKFNEITGLNGRDFLEDIRKHSLSVNLDGQSIYSHYVNKYKLRKLALLGGSISSCDITKDSSDAVISYVESTIRQIDSFSVSESTMTNKEAVKAVNDKIEKIASGDNNVYFPTKIKDIDDIIIGLQKKTYNIIAARPSVGKTALGVAALSNMTAEGNVGGFLSIEMDTVEIMERLIQNRADVNIFDMALQRTCQADIQKYMAASQELANSDNIIIRDTTNRSISNIKSMIKKMKRDNPELEFVFVDYIQKIRSDNHKLSGDEVGQIKEASGMLTDLAKDLDIIIIGLAQLNRGEADKTPSMQGLKGASDLEQDAYIIMLIDRDLKAQREANDNNDDITELDADIIIAKNRGGKTGVAHCKYNAKTTAFYSPSIADGYRDHGM